MHLVAIRSGDSELMQKLWRFRDPLGRFHLHPVAEHSAVGMLAGLEPLEFAGAVILDPAEQSEVPRQLRRSSMEVQESQAADTVTVTPAGLIGEFNFGRALGELLKSSGWHAQGARAVILGSGARARAAARELSSLGISELALVAGSRPEAEQSAPQLAASSRVVTFALHEPGVGRLLQDSDLILRLDDRMTVPPEVLGPHLILVDLGSQSVSRLRSQALNVGALSFNSRDVEAYFMSLALGQILGGRIDTEPFLTLFHEGSS